MIALIFCLMMDYRVPIDYYWEEKEVYRMYQPTNRRQRRNRGHYKGHKSYLSNTGL